MSIRVDPAGPVGEFDAPPTGNGGALIRLAATPDITGNRTTVVASARPAQAGTHTVKVLVKPLGDLFGGDPTVVTLQATSLTVLH